jgi:hypothetical protein
MVRIGSITLIEVFTLHPELVHGLLLSQEFLVQFKDGGSVRIGSLTLIEVFTLHPELGHSLLLSQEFPVQFKDGVTMAGQRVAGPFLLQVDPLLPNIQILGSFLLQTDPLLFKLQNIGIIPSPDRSAPL